MVAAALAGVAVAGVAGAAISSSGASDAASQQSAAANNATNAQTAAFEQERQDLAPYMQAGIPALNNLNNLTGNGPGGNPLTSPLGGPIVMDEAALQKTPGYQFNLTQGEKAVQNAAAARGLGSSGAALKGAAAYATGLADNTYQNQFNNAVTNQTNSFNKLMGLTQLGQNSAAGVGAAGIQTAANIGSNLIGAGNAQAAASIAGANAFGNAAGGIGNALLTNQLLGGGGGLFGGGGASSSGTVSDFGGNVNEGFG